jgi:hypothetical protein
MDPIGVGARPSHMGDRARDYRLRALIRSQGGVLSVRQALDTGLGRAGIAAKVRSGEWTRA